MSYTEARQIISDCSRLLDQANKNLLDAIQEMNQSKKNSIEAKVVNSYNFK